MINFTQVANHLLLLDSEQKMKNYLDNIFINQQGSMESAFLNYINNLVGDEIKDYPENVKEIIRSHFSL